MIDVITVAKAVKKMADIDDGEDFEIIPTVTVACAELSDRLKKEEYAADERVINAAVCLSFYRLVIKQTSSGEISESFKAGDVTVSQSPSLAAERAAALRDEAFVAASPLLCDVDFVFEQV